ncbi:MAG: putative manganese-dependent inorganic diphosphatase [Syntrophomonadaceae bacterium]|nr:putative manganese-dependent inorganic diphosphatase [Syntrophomonadaceae bacterium]MDD4548722.1 putative manganese-dependent inorganic diphosphatase [Syntrophomonadaceae bacterium]
MKPIYVIGHKNPDVDSIAAAISYKVYKQSNESGLYIAAAAGEINDEIKYILDTFGFDLPMVIRNVGTNVEDLLDDNSVIYVTTDISLVELGNLMRKHNLKTVPVLDENKRFLGLVTIGDLAMLFLDNLGGGREIEKSPEILRHLLEQRVADIMKTRNLMLFEKDEPVEEARKQMLATRFRNYPVVDENNHFMGMISRYNLLEMKRKQLILVDHNERKQAVEGIEEAEILEIIDHHRVGDLQTLSPIYFRNEPVGSTCTLVAEIFFNNSTYIGSNLAALMLSGILADTMIFKSPTTTAKDRSIASELAGICGLNPMEWGKEIFENAMQLENQTDEQIIQADMKEYISGSATFAISQVETIDLKRFSLRKESLVKNMIDISRRKEYAFMCLMVTDILDEGTELLIAGEKKYIAERAFGHTTVNGSIFLKGVMSRKKQVVPVIYEVLRRENLM